jgi:hypothetical protein
MSYGDYFPTMIGKLISLLWTLVKLPIKLILLPYRIVSAIISLIIYATILLIASGIIYFFVL